MWTDLSNVRRVDPRSRTRAASASPSDRAGRQDSLLAGLMSLHWKRVGWDVARGGTMTRRPEWRRPIITAPRASTTKLTRNLTTMSALLAAISTSSPSSSSAVAVEVVVVSSILSSLLSPLKLANKLSRRGSGWLCGVVVRASDLWSRGREFESRPVHYRVG